MMANNNIPTRFVTYNLHGWNNGSSGLLELCNNPIVYISLQFKSTGCVIMTCMINSFHTDFAGFGLSSMTNRLCSEVYRGRPYGGVAFLWRKSISHIIKIQSKAMSGRALCISLDCDNVGIVNVINVHLPCFTSSVEYSSSLLIA